MSEQNLTKRTMSEQNLTKRLDRLNIDVVQFTHYNQLVSVHNTHTHTHTQRKPSSRSHPKPLFVGLSFSILSTQR